VRRFEIATKTGLGGRLTQQDAMRVVEQEGVVCCLLADGLGGLEGGGDAAALAVEVFAGELNRGPLYDGATLSRCWQAAGEALADYSSEPRRRPARTTLAALLTDGRSAYRAHVGDTRIYWFREGALKQRTIDHSLVQALVDAGRIAAGEAAKHPDRNRLLRSLGGPQVEAPEVDAEGIVVEPGDVFLLATDGSWEHFDDSELAVGLGGGAPLDEWLEGRWGEMERQERAELDNATAIAVRIKQS
jgi:serine/threonine protein phosphatase PrpC